MYILFKNGDIVMFRLIEEEKYQYIGKVYYDRQHCVRGRVKEEYSCYTAVGRVCPVRGV